MPKLLTSVKRRVQLDTQIAEFFDSYLHDERTGKREYGAFSDLVNRLLLAEMKRLKPVVELLKETKDDNFN